MMTRKDYIEIAKILNNFLADADEFPALTSNFDDFLVQPFIKMFEKDNPNFNAEKFWEACYND